MGNEYLPRIADEMLKNRLDCIGAVQIVGPKWCGKTTTAKMFSNSAIYLQDPDNYERYSQIAENKLSILLEGETPRLIDEWQTIPEIWDGVRYSVDSRSSPGQFILTGSVTVDKSKRRHSGTGRIDTMAMRTMSLYESGDSTGSVRLSSLFAGDKDVDSKCELGYSDYSSLIIRGGWPSTVKSGEKESRLLVKSYCESLLDTESVDEKRKSPEKMRHVLRSLSRNIGTSVPNSVILGDMGNSIHENTLADYLDYLGRIYVIDNTPSWNPVLRSKTMIRQKDTRYFVDPAIAAYFLSAGKKDIESDPKTYGFLFENLAMRDLKVYADSLGGTVRHYHDRNDLEVDAIVHLDDGKWGAIEIKLGSKHIKEAIDNLHELRLKVNDEIEKGPSFLAVVTGTEYAYTEDDVQIIPLGCLRP